MLVLHQRMKDHRRVCQGADLKTRHVGLRPARRGAQRGLYGSDGAEDHTWCSQGL